MPPSEYCHPSPLTPRELPALCLALSNFQSLPLTTSPALTSGLSETSNQKNSIINTTGYRQAGFTLVIGHHLLCTHAAPSILCSALAQLCLTLCFCLCFVPGSALYSTPAVPDILHFSRCSFHSLPPSSGVNLSFYLTKRIIACKNN